MFKRLFATALIAGIASGLLSALLQAVLTTPLILAAEQFEGTNQHAQAPITQTPITHAAVILVHGSGGAEGEAWAPGDGIERTLYTSAATIVTAVAFALLLTVAMAVREAYYKDQINGRKGVIWGLAGFAVVTLAPALGLPPELPGSAAADIGARQSWWIATVVMSAAGLWLMIFSERRWLPLLGMILLAAPHIYGAPHPETLTSTAPAELAAAFAARALAITACFWAVLGFCSGALFHHFNPARATAPEPIRS